MTLKRPLIIIAGCDAGSSPLTRSFAYVLADAISSKDIEVKFVGKRTESWLGIRCPNGLLAALAILFSSRPSTTLYYGIDHQTSALPAVTLILLGRLRGLRVLVHHHHAIATGERSALIGAVMKMKGVVHIVSSDAMYAELVSENQNGRIVICGTAAAISRTSSRAATIGPPNRLGLLGPIVDGKGLDVALDLTIAARAEGLDLSLTVVGLVQLDKERWLLSSAANHLGDSVRYVAVQEDGADEAVLSEIDILILPSTSEAEMCSWAVLQALAHGIVPIASDQGGVRDLMGGAGELVHRNVSFVPEALFSVRKWTADPDRFADLRRSAIVRFDELKTQADAQFQSLLAEFALE